MHIQRSVTRIAAGAGALAAALAIASTATAATGSTGATNPCKSPTTFRGVIAATYKTYCEVCRDTGWRQIRRDYLIKPTVIGRIAAAYAAIDQFGAYRTAATRGCIRGFTLRGKP